VGELIFAHFPPMNHHPIAHHPVALAVLFTVALPTAAAAATWYVSGTGRDSNSGTTLQAPFAALQHAADLTSPGDTVMVLNGTYVVPCKGCGVLNSYNSGTAAAPITYRAYPGQKPVIDFNYG
jgi:hypothetical protein